MSEDGDYTYSTYEMQQIREWMDKYNLKAKSLHATIGTDRDVFTLCGNYRRDFTADCEYNRKAGVELIKNRVDLASVMRTSEIVLHLYVPYKTLEKEPKRKAKFYENVKKSMDELQPYCLEKGVRICMENLFDMPMEYMEEQWDWFLANYPKEFLGFCLDSGHANMLWGADMIRIIHKYKTKESILLALTTLAMLIPMTFREWEILTGKKPWLPWLLLLMNCR